MNLLHFALIGFSMIAQAQSPIGPQQEYNQTIAAQKQQQAADSSNFVKGKKPIADSSYGSAVSGQNANQSSGLISGVVGKGLLSAGQQAMPHCCGRGHCCSRAVTMVTMGIMGLMQSAANTSAAFQHGTVSMDVGFKQGLIGPGAAQNSTEIQSEINSGFSILKNVGANLDIKNGKMTFPDGKSVGLSSLGDSSAMAAAGVSADDMKLIKKSLSDLQTAAIQKAGSQKETTPSDSDYVSGSVTANNVGSAGGDSADGHRLNDKAAIDRELAAVSVAGMAKNYNGDLIGVSGDDIFNMMARRYQQKSKDDSFLSPESSPNMPALNFKE